MIQEPTPTFDNGSEPLSQIDQVLYINYGAELWSSTSKAAVAPSQINVTENVESLLADDSKVSNLLARFGLIGLDHNSIYSFSVALAEGQSGAWNGTTYTPSWDVAFSADDIIFILTIGVKDPLDSSYILEGLTNELYLNFDRSGVDLSTLIYNPASSAPLEVSSNNGVGLLLAFGADRQAALGIADKPISISLPDEGLSVSFSEEQLEALLSIKMGGGFNDAPVAVADSLTATEDTAVTYTANQLLGNDTDVDVNTLKIASVSSGTGGTAVRNTDGTVTFTPSANFNGAANFSYTVSDGTLTSNAATVTVNVAAVNDAPTLTLISTTDFTEDAAGNAVGSVVASFSTADEEGSSVIITLSDATNYVLGTGANAGKVLLTAAGLALVNAGTDLPAFTLTPNDGTTNGTAVSVDPSVAPVNDALNDTNAPTAPVLAVIAGDDRINNAEKSAGVTLSGTAEPLSSVSVSWSDSTRTTQAAANGTWTLAYGAAQIPADGASSIAVTSTDAAGNVSTTTTRVVTIDTVVPAVPLLDAVAGDDRINSLERAAGIILRGTAEAASTVSVMWGAGSTPRTTTTSGNGTWSLTYSASEIPTAASSTIVLTSTDGAGNTSTALSRSISVFADNLVPSSLSILAAAIPSNAAPGYTAEIGKLVAVDPDQDPLSFILDAASPFNDNALIDLNPTTGAITLKAGLSQVQLTAALARSSLRISATARENVVGRSEPLSISRTLLIPVVAPAALNNRSPVATATNAILASIAERSSASSINGSSVVTLFGAFFSDSDQSDQLAGIALVGNQAQPEQGSWQYRTATGSVWIELPLVGDDQPFILLPGDQLRFVPGRSFVGTPGALSARLLDTSRSWQRGALPLGEGLAIGGFGSASAELVTLATSITAVLKSPRSLLLLTPDGVGALEGVPVDSGPAPFAQAQGADPDTPATGLTYSLLEARGTSGTPYPELFSIDPTTGAITRIGAALPSGETEISFKVRVSDGITTPLERSFRVGVLSDLNRAPLVVAGSEQRSLAAVAEGSANPAGATVAALFGPSFADSPALQQSANTPGTLFAGVAVVQNAATAIQGAWQYRLNSNDPWKVLPAVAETTPVILTAQTELRFLPRPNFAGTPGALSARLLDGSQPWTTGTLNSTLPTGGGSSASSSLVTLATSITGQPKAPDSLTQVPGALLDATAAPGSAIAQLRATDPDTATNQLIYELLPAAASNDNSLVSVDFNGTVRLAVPSTDPQLKEARSRSQLRIAVQVRDPGGLILQKTLQIAAENDTNRAPKARPQEASLPSWAPLASADVLRQSVYLEPIDQGTSVAAILGRRVEALFGSSEVFSDPAGDFNASSTFAGIAVVADAAATNPLNGRWQYFSAGAWQPFPLITEERPLLLRADAQLRFVPASAFSGIPGPLSVRLLDNSITVANGLLPQEQVLIAGGSGAASTQTVELLTHVARNSVNQNPSAVFFNTQRSIPNTDGLVQAGVLLGTFAGMDRDTPTGELAYTLITTSIKPDSLSNKLLVSGNQLRVGGTTVTVAELQALQFKVAVSDRLDSNQVPVLFDIGPTFQLRSTSFTASEDLTIRSETSVLPALTGNGDAGAVLFSATGLAADLTVNVGPVLTTDDLSGFDPSSLGITQNGQGATSVTITPLTPLLDFNIALDTPGEIVRFEFELPQKRLRELLEINYLKLSSDGAFSVFDYRTDDFGVSTGARLEQKEDDIFIAFNRNPFAQDQIVTLPVYLAVYVQDNGRGDDDQRLGFVRDPGLPTSLKTVVPPTIFSIGGTDRIVSSNTDDNLITGSGEVGATLELFFGSTKLGQVLVAEGGTFSYQLTVDNLNSIAQGTGKSITAKQTDNAGNTETSAAFIFAVDTTSTQSDNPFISPREPAAGDLLLGSESNEVRVSSKSAFGTGSFFTGAGDDNLKLSAMFAKRSVYVDAGEGNDVVVTRAGSDTIRGGAGNDYLKASTSAGRHRRPEVDRLEGGADADTFVLAASSRKSLYLDIKGRGASSYALITDFDDMDKLLLAGRRRSSYSISRDFVPVGMEGTAGFALFDGNDLVAYVIAADPAVVASVDLDDPARFNFVGPIRS